MRLGILLLNPHRFDPSDQPLIRALHQLAIENPSHIFYSFQFSNAAYSFPECPENILIVSLGMKKTNRFLSRFILKKKLLRLLQEFNIDHMLIDEPAISGLTFPSLIYLHALPGEVISARQQTILLEAKKILCASPAGLTMLRAMLPPLGDTLLHIPPDLLSTPSPIEQGEDEATAPYWLYLGWHDQPDPYLMLLKAFSVFKKWTHSGLKLRFLYPPDALGNHLQTYKYRSDVWLPDQNQAAQTIREQAFAYLDFSNAVSIHQAAYFAVRHRKALLVPTHPEYEQLYENGLYYASDRPEQIGKQLIQIYKDETAVHEKIAFLQQHTATWNHQSLGQALLDS
ncbi:MAG: hypothetical protein ACKO5C_01685 [Ferruginibacter sp.]